MFGDTMANDQIVRMTIHSYFLIIYIQKLNALNTYKTLICVSAIHMQLGAWRVSSNANRNRRQRSDNEKETRRVGAMVKLAKAKEISMNTDTPVRARAIFFFLRSFFSQKVSGG